MCVPPQRHFLAYAKHPQPLHPLQRCVGTKGNARNAAAAPDNYVELVGECKKHVAKLSTLTFVPTYEELMLKYPKGKQEQYMERLRGQCGSRGFGSAAGVRQRAVCACVWWGGGMDNIIFQCVSYH